MDYAKAKQRDHQRQAERLTSTAEIVANRSGEIARIIAGMGQGKRPPCKRIDPNSAEGRAIAARFSD